jgi:hypothetical protein
MSATAQRAQFLSEYETARARNIEKHNAQLFQLGLISKDEELASNARAWGISIEEKKEAKKRKAPKAQHSPIRQSKRVKGLEPDGTERKVQLSPPSAEDVHTMRKRRVLECREARQRAALQYAELGLERAAKENPTATYEHALMRIKTMTEKKLQNRIKVIERAAGKHCVVKMAIFKSCLQDEGMWELAELAGEALERLKALKPPPK